VGRIGDGVTIGFRMEVSRAGAKLRIFLSWVVDRRESEGSELSSVDYSQYRSRPGGPMASLQERVRKWSGGAVMPTGSHGPSSRESGRRPAGASRSSTTKLVCSFTRS